MVARSVLGDDAVEVDKLDEEGPPTAGPLTTFGYDLDVSDLHLSAETGLQEYG